MNCSTDHREAAVLVVDDEVDICRNLSDILSDLGFQVDVAHDGESALERVRSRVYDVALLDLRMPGMDGLTLYRRIREISAGTMAVVITAYVTGETTSEALEAGAFRVLSKPVDVGRLMESVESILDQPMVLVVDDDHELSWKLWSLLRRQGYRVCLASNERQAARWLDSSSYRVVLISLRLPGGDGRAVLQMVRQKCPRARTILISGCRGGEETLVDEALHAGADGVCYKPFDPPGLIDTVRRLIAEQRAAEGMRPDGGDTDRAS